MERCSASSSSERSSTISHSATTSQPSLNMHENDDSDHNQNVRDHSPLLRALAHPPTSITNQSDDSAQQSSLTKSASSNSQNHTAKRLKLNNQSTAAPNEDDIQSDSDSDDSLDGWLWQGGRYVKSVDILLIPKHVYQMDHGPQSNSEPASRTQVSSIQLINLDSDQSEIDSEDEHQANRENWQCYLSNACTQVFSNQNDLVRHAYTDHQNVNRYQTSPFTKSIEFIELDDANSVQHLNQQHQQFNANTNHHSTTSSATVPLCYAAFPLKQVILHSATKLSSSEVCVELNRLRESNAISNEDPSTVSLTLGSETNPIEKAQIRVDNLEANSLSNYRPQSSDNSIQRPPTIITSAANPIQLAQVSVPNRDAQSLSNYIQQSSVKLISQPTITNSATWKSVTSPVQQAQVHMPNCEVHSHSNQQSTTSTSDSLVGTTSPIKLPKVRSAVSAPLHTAHSQSCQQQIFNVDATEQVKVNASNRFCQIKSKSNDLNQQQQQQPVATRVSVIVYPRQAIAQLQNDTQNALNAEPQPQNSVTIVFLKCNHCKEYTTKSKEALKDHKLSVHGVDSFECLIRDCSKSFGSENAMAKHRRNDHKSNKRLGKFACKVCNKLYGYYSNLEDHWISKHTNALYKCSFCEFHSLTEERVFFHVRVSHPTPDSDPRDYHRDDQSDHEFLCLQCYELNKPEHQRARQLASGHH